MAGRIRRGTLTVNSVSVAGVANFEWNDAYEMDRSRADNESAGTPVLMKTGGSGSFTLLSGSVASGYAAGNVVLTYIQVTQAAGVETPTNKTATFTGVTFNTGGSVPAEGRGEIKVSFEYATSALA